jgi:hypothetical protein
MSAGTPAPQLQFFEWTVALAEQRSKIRNSLHFSENPIFNSTFLHQNRK